METEALSAALREEWREERAIDALERFLKTYPASRWAPVIHLDLGRISYEKGYFQGALAHWKAGWDLAKGGEDVVSQDIANLALAESAKMNARIGRLNELEALLTEAQKRTPMGAARVKIESAAEGAWMMHNRPGVSFLCGPYALLSVARELTPEVAKRASAFLEKTESPLTGFSIPEVHRMSTELGLKLQIAKREVGAPIIVPAVVHWKLGHFAAVVREVNGGFLLKDPTFGDDMSITAKALDREASGYFLVPSGPLPPGWSGATVIETAQLYGKGYTALIADNNTADFDHQVGGSCQSGLAMATYRFHTLTASLHIEDTPISYKPAFGPEIKARVTYNQREANQPTAMHFTNFGPQFGSNWVSYYAKGTTFNFAVAGGGHYSAPIGGIAPPVNPQRGETFSELTGRTGKMVFPDGHEEYYEHAEDAEPGTDRPLRTFLSRIVDPQGNEVTIDYDTTYPTRIHQIVDATGLPTEFHYDYPGEPYLVTSIEDPYGRAATFSYVLTAGKLRLQSIEDPYGIESSFTYSPSGEVLSMTTPYGTTTFNLSAPYVGAEGTFFRYVEATDPLGQTERVEFNAAASTGVPSGVESPRPNASAINYVDGGNNYRNSFYWDKLLTKLAPRDYRKAHLYHWTHDGQASSTVTDILESEVVPLEGRVFYNYAGQTSPAYPGTLGFPSAIGRVVTDAGGGDQTQVTRFAYNARANVTKLIDPVGRETAADYAPNGIDILAVRQKTGPSTWTAISSYSYGGGAPPHRPASVTDGSGNTTTYTYSPATGQVLTITNAKSEVMTFTYELNASSTAYGRLLSITGDIPGGNRMFTYDSYGRVRTMTDSQSYTLTYDYDSLDRIRTIGYPDGSLEQLEYADHSLVATKDRDGRWTRHMSNPLMQRVLTQDPSLRMTQLQWCRCGGLQRLVDGSGNVTEWERDEAGRVKRKIDPNGSFDGYTYDISGRLSSEVDGMSRTVTYRYGVDDRLVKMDFSDAATPDVTYVSDPWFPRIVSRQDGAGTTSFTYHPYGALANGAGQVALVNGPLANDTLKQTYDQLGRLKKLEIVDDATQTTASYSEEFTFDARSRVIGVLNNLGASTYAFVGQSGRPAKVDYPNGMQILYDYYEAAGDFRLREIKNASGGASSTPISQFDYAYRRDGSIEKWAVDQGSGPTTWTLGYDPVRQLTSAVRRDASSTVLDTWNFGYDKAANRIQAGSGATAPKNYETNRLNQLLSERDHGRTTFRGFVNEPATVKVNGAPARVTSTDGGAPFNFEADVNLAVGSNTVTVAARDGSNNLSTRSYSVTTTGAAKNFEYDANGNLRFERLPGSAVIKEYRWDQQNRLVRILAGTHESVYEYDGVSHRVRARELVNGVETKNETFVWCGSQICQKRTGSTVLRSYFGNGFEESGTTDYFYTRDHLGSVREVVGSDGTTIGARLSYDLWGKVEETGSMRSDITFTGHHYDRSTGLVFAQYRAYDSQAGRWLNRDPIGVRGGLNLYGYANNDPVNLFDPTGRTPKPGAVAWLVELVVNKGIHLREALTHEAAVEAARGGENILAKDQATARRIATGGSDGFQPFSHAAHFETAGPEARPHYHVIDPETGEKVRKGGHVFWGVGGVPALAPTSDADSAADLLMDIYEFFSPVISIGDALKPYLTSQCGATAS